MSRYRNKRSFVNAVGKDHHHHHVASTDIPDPLSPLLPIIHRLWQVFRPTSRILTQLLNVCSSWSSCFCSAICGGPQEYITYELVPASSAVSCMCGSSNLDSFRDERQVAVQLVPCGVFPPGLVQYCSQRSCVIAIQLLLQPFSQRLFSASIQQFITQLWVKQYNMPFSTRMMLVLNNPGRLIYH